LRKNGQRFDEVMIVNPYDPAAGDEGARLMQFHYAEPPEYGYYAEPDPYGYYGYYGCNAAPSAYAGWGQYEPMNGYGYSYAEPPDMGYYGQADPYGYYAEPYDYAGWGAPGYGAARYEGYGEPEYAEYEPLNGYGEPEYAEYEPVGYYADENPIGYYGDSPELVGWGDPAFEGYVRDGKPTYNPTCPMPTNVAGLGEADFDGYVHPGTVNPIVDTFTAQPGPTPGVPDTFRPLW
jgi:hypothetical protein